MKKELDLAQVLRDSILKANKDLGFLKEQTEEEQKPSHLKHLTHVNMHHIDDGEEGYHNAIAMLNAVHDHITTGGHNDSRITTKYDGSPSIVFGRHPQTGKFFVASKSAFNKNPKINYSAADVIRNHGHAPGLVDKLTQALEHLPKIAPKHGVYQGDVLFSGKDKKTEGGSTKFTPNTITYSADNPEDEKRIKRAKFGIYNHTQYVGPTAKSMTANYSPDLSNFKEHPDVYHRTPGHDTSKVKLRPEVEKRYEEHLKAAEKIHNQHGGYMYDALENPGSLGSLRDHVKTYINSTG